jgi:hypothetical protein
VPHTHIHTHVHDTPTRAHAGTRITWHSHTGAGCYWCAVPQSRLAKVSPAAVVQLQRHAAHGWVCCQLHLRKKGPSGRAIKAIDSSRAAQVAVKGSVPTQLPGRMHHTHTHTHTHTASQLRSESALLQETHTHTLFLAYASGQPPPPDAANCQRELQQPGRQGQDCKEACAHTRSRAAVTSCATAHTHTHTHTIQTPMHCRQPPHSRHTRACAAGSDDAMCCADTMPARTVSK